MLKIINKDYYDILDNPTRGDQSYFILDIENILSEAKKNKSISLRISSHDLEQLKEKANDEGIPYQTLINSVLHKYVTKQFYEKEQMLRSLKLMPKA